MDDQSVDTAAQLAAITSLDALYAAAERQHLTPAWIRREPPIMWHRPRSRYVPAHWRYDLARATLTAACDLIDVAQADRRNVALRNPAPGTNFETTRTQVAAYQIILPGEYAPPHRHAPHALRMILDGEGLYSVVDGIRMPMRPGDVVLTPGGSWHGHGHDGVGPASWLDILDVPFAHLNEAVYFEQPPGGEDPVRETLEVHPYRFAAADIAAGLASQTRIILPTPSMPSFELSATRVPAGTTHASARSTENRIFAIMSGSGRAVVEGLQVAWNRGDVVCAPCWTAAEFHAETDSVIFCASDAPALRFAGYHFTDADLG